MKKAKFVSEKDLYDVSYATHGWFHDIYLVMKNRLNFTGNLYRRKKSHDWGTIDAMPNGTLLYTGMFESMFKGQAEMVCAP